MKIPGHTAIESPGLRRSGKRSPMMDGPQSPKATFGKGSILKASNSGHFNSSHGSKVAFQDIMNQAAAEQDLAEEKPSDKPARSETKLTVTETYNIENSPWNNVETQGVNFEDYKARIKAQLEQENFKQNLEQNRLGDLTKDDTEVTKFDK